MANARKEKNSREDDFQRSQDARDRKRLCSTYFPGVKYRARNTDGELAVGHCLREKRLEGGEAEGVVLAPVSARDTQMARS